MTEFEIIVPVVLRCDEKPEIDYQTYVGRVMEALEAYQKIRSELLSANLAGSAVLRTLEVAMRIEAADQWEANKLGVSFAGASAMLCSSTTGWHPSIDMASFFDRRGSSRRRLWTLRLVLVVNVIAFAANCWTAYRADSWWQTLLQVGCASVNFYIARRILRDLRILKDQNRYQPEREKLS